MVKTVGVQDGVVLHKVRIGACRGRRVKAPENILHPDHHHSLQWPNTTSAHQRELRFMGARKRKAAQYDDPDDWLPVPDAHWNYASNAAGSSSNPIVLDSPPAPKAKRARKTKDAGAPAPEKRGAIMKKKCPQNILDRVERVMTQRYVEATLLSLPVYLIKFRIFMIDRNRVDGELKEEFSVLGSTGNVYIVTIDHRPRCNCMSSSKMVIAN